jgi:hypothetical protein
MTTATRRQRYYVVEAGTNGVLILTPMKRWLRQHPEYLPDDRDPREWHSRQLAAHLRALGWQVEQSFVCIAPPG